jgi:seryl-tRNA synthetase
MHDIKFIRENPEAFDAGLARRGVGASSFFILDDDKNQRQIETRRQEWLAKRNQVSKEIGRAKAAKDEQLASQLLAQAEELKQLMANAESQEATLKFRVRDALSSLPNLPDADVPVGIDESQNEVVGEPWGTRRNFNFQPKEHADLGPALGLDFETGVLISGSRFTFLRGQMARLQRALGQFMLDHQTVVNGYSETAPPLIVKDEAAFGTGQLPKFAEDLFQTSVRKPDDEVYAETFQALANLTADQDEQIGQILDGIRHDPANRRWLIPTAEVSLTNSVREQILTESALPIRLTALTPCFRSEAGAAGKDTRGYIRQHQFEKVELVTICKPEDSAAEHERMVKAAESILEALELPYRKMLLCAGDMGFTARKTFDLEVWLPGQDAYREISSVSNCGDFQARRMNARYRPEGGKGTEFVHTLNGSGLAVGRTLVAVLENYQQEDGSVTVPTALLPYMGGITALVPN